jgi:predicted ATPase/transcriptional regulator with XRE-family HTH domain
MIDKTRRFGEVLREFRLAAGLSQEALAERATISANGISALERGVNQAPQQETLALLMGALELGPEQQQELEDAAVHPSHPRISTGRAGENHNLPRSLTPLYGREGEIAYVTAMVQSTPLVTLTGAGGIGKTRLALQVGSELLRQFTDGVWFVDIAALRDAQFVPSALAAPFGVKESPDQPLIEALVHALRSKKLLLIVDNCEHLVTSAAAAIKAIIDECPQVRVLATSRQSLDVPGEQINRVESLAVPEESERISADAALRYAGVELFNEHAKRASASFALTDENAQAVAEICCRLDGIALAIELAAARVKFLTPQQLSELLSEGFSVLTGGSRMKLPRQQTVRATIDWSYDLLDAHERTLFRRLAVFAAGFSLEAVMAICSDEGIDEWRIVELLGSLVDKSLVTAEQCHAAQRYRMLETVRAYALEKAYDANDVGTFSRRHAEYYTALAERAQAAFKTAPSAVAWAASLDEELENVRAGLDWALGLDGDAVLGARLLSMLTEFWILHGYETEAARRAECALTHASICPKATQAELWLTLSRMQHDWILEPRALLDSALRAAELYEGVGDRVGLAWALREQGNAHIRLGAYDKAEALFRRTLPLFREGGESRGVTRILASFAWVLQLEGRLDEAKAAILEVIETARSVGDERTASVASVNLAENEFALGDVQGAIDRATHTLANDEMLRKSAPLRATQESNLAVYLLSEARYDEARKMALRAMVDADSIYGAVPLQHVAAILARTMPKRAAKLLGFIENIFAATGFKREHTERYSYDRLMSALRETMSDDEIGRLMREGAVMTEDQACKLAGHRHDGKKRTSVIAGTVT